ncbi:MAG: hypothetical protein ABMA14_18105 [Hyphomonadaceae bacterium]
MSFFSRARIATAIGILSALSLGLADASLAENTTPSKGSTPSIVPLAIDATPQPKHEPVDDMPSGNSFACEDSSRMVLNFADVASGVDAIVSIHGDTFRLPALPNIPGVAEINWSDGANSLTWSTGVRLMWMSGSTHLMCGRSHHH